MYLHSTVMITKTSRTW